MVILGWGGGLSRSLEVKGFMGAGGGGGGLLIRRTPMVTILIDEYREDVRNA